MIAIAVKDYEKKSIEEYRLISMKNPDDFDDYVDYIKYLKELILDYNGNAPDYENIEAIYIDAGAGGGGVNIADFLMEDWVDKHGVKHRGLIDKEYSAEYVRKFPNAIDKLRLMPPSKYKSMMY